jgi:predicted ATPase/DNA-binding XRE family transcriptional regulator
MGRGLTREQLANQIGCAVITLRKIEAEERRPSVQIVKRLAEIFEIPQSERTNFLKYARGDWTKAPGASSGEKPWQASKSPRMNLPAPLTSFIGREKEQAEIIDLLAKNRLVTLTGAGGIGKTRLSIEAARGVLAEFQDGTFFVALAPLPMGDPNLIARAVVQALGFVEVGNLPAEKQLVEGIGGKRMLLVLDNCEHLIEGVAALASDLLSTCSQIKIIATSRESLRIPGEWLYAVPTLGIIPEENMPFGLETASKSPMLMLFAERARAVRSDFTLTKDNLQPVTSICMQLDGLPLAIELIAARVRLMPPQALLERMSGQFILTADGLRSTSERQKTLNNAIGWSYNLLSEAEQKLFAYLSVFSGGFTLDAAEAMFSQTFTGKSISNLVASLLDKSLLQRALEREARVEARYTMLVTIQEFARECLLEMGEATEIRDRHLTYFCELAEQARPQLRGAGQLAWLDRLEDEYGNIRAALNWAQEGGAIAEGLRLATDLEWFWFWRTHWQEPILALENLLARPLPADEIRALARGHEVVGFLELALGNRTAGYAHAQESERLCLLLGPEGKVNLAWVRNLLNDFTQTTFEKEPNQVHQSYDEVLKLFQESGDQWQTATIIYDMGYELGRSGDFIGARQALEQGLRLFRECGDMIGASRLNGLLAHLALDEGKYTEARAQLEENLHFYRQARLSVLIDIPLWMLGVIAMREGDYARQRMVHGMPAFRPTDWFDEATRRMSHRLRGHRQRREAFRARRAASGRRSCRGRNKGSPFGEY